MPVMFVAPSVARVFSSIGHASPALNKRLAADLFRTLYATSTLIAWPPENLWELTPAPDSMFLSGQVCRIFQPLHC
jgi:hypothetical protein